MKFSFKKSLLGGYIITNFDIYSSNDIKEKYGIEVKYYNSKYYVIQNQPLELLWFDSKSNKEIRINFNEHIEREDIINLIIKLQIAKKYLNMIIKENKQLMQKTYTITI